MYYKGLGGSVVRVMGVLGRGFKPAVLSKITLLASQDYASLHPGVKMGNWLGIGSLCAMCGSSYGRYLKSKNSSKQCYV